VATLQGASDCASAATLVGAGVLNDVGSPGDYITYTDSTTTLTATTTPQTLTWGSHYHTKGTGLSYSAGQFRVHASVPYLINYCQAWETSDNTSGETIQIQSEILVNGIAIEAGKGYGYISKAGGAQECTIGGKAIVELLAGDVVEISYYRTDDSTVGTVTRMSDWGTFGVLELSDTDEYGIYHTAGSDTTTGSFVTLPFDTVDREDAAFTMNTSTGVLTINTTGTYVMTVGGDASISTTNTTEAYLEVILNSTRIEGARSYCLMNGADACQDAAFSQMFMFEAVATDTVKIQIADEGDTVTFGAGFQWALWELPVNKKTIILEATGGNMNVGYNSFDWDTIKQIDQYEFSHIVGEDEIKMRAADNHLFMLSIARTTSSTAANTLPRGDIQVNNSYTRRAVDTFYNVGTGNFGKVSYNNVLVTTDTAVYNPPDLSVRLVCVPWGSGTSVEASTGQFAAVRIIDLWDDLTVKSAADATSAFTVTAAGTVATGAAQGASTPASDFAVTAAGTRHAAGAATPASAFTATADGNVAEATFQGAATPASDFAATAAGLMFTPGSATPASDFAATAAGLMVTPGVATHASDFAVTADAIATVQAAADAASDHAATAVATRHAAGAADAASDFTATAAGTIATATLQGSATPSSDFTATAAALMVTPGAADVASDHDVAAAATLTSQGSATPSSDFVATADATLTSQGGADATSDHTATAAGLMVTPGAATPASDFAATAAGLMVTPGAADTTSDHTASAAGLMVTPGAATPASDFVATADATLTSQGVADATSDHTATADAIATVQAAADAVSDFEVTAAGIAGGQGQAFCVSDHSVTASGLMVAPGAADATSDHTATAVATRHVVAAATPASDFTATAAGTRHVVGAATPASDFTATSVATYRAQSTAAAASDFEVTANNNVTLQAGADAASAFTATAEGAAIGTEVGVADAVSAFTATSTATAIIRSSSSPTTAFVATAAATKKSIGAAVVLTQSQASFVGLRVTPGLAAIISDFDATAVGNTGQLPGEALAVTAFLLTARGTYAGPKLPIAGQISPGLTVGGDVVEDLGYAATISAEETIQ